MIMPWMKAQAARARAGLPAARWRGGGAGFEPVGHVCARQHLPHPLRARVDVDRAVELLGHGGQEMRAQ
jgi:hypothetical protein